MNKVFRFLSKVIFFVGIITIWQLYPLFTATPSYILPTPLEAATAIANNIQRISRDLAYTLGETIAGFALGALGGIASAIGIYRSNYLRGTLYPTLISLNSFPKVLLAPLLILWLGFGAGPKIFLAAIICFFPIVINTLTGLTQVEPDLIDLCKVYGANEWKMFRKVRIMNSLPHMFDSFKIAVPLALIGAVVGEFLSGGTGLGYLAEVSTTFFEADLTMGIIVVMIFVSLGLYAVVIVAEKRILFWVPSARRR